jgi:hypothetical protein
MVTGKRGADMTAVVSAEHAARTWFTGASGLLIVAAAFAMMAWAAPAHAQAQAQPHRPAPAHSVTVSQLESQVWPASPGARTPIAGRR